MRLGSIAALPEESRFAKALSIKAVHMNSDGSYSVVREAWDGTKTHILLSTYGRPEGLRTVVAPAAWSAVRLGDGVARASEKRGGETYLVNAAMP